jgi:hypothetical protein
MGGQLVQLRFVQIEDCGKLWTKQSANALQLVQGMRTASSAISNRHNKYLQNRGSLKYAANSVWFTVSDE